jgi:hypothetical protein
VSSTRARDQTKRNKPQKENKQTTGFNKIHHNAQRKKQKYKYKQANNLFARVFASCLFKLFDNLQLLFTLLAIYFTHSLTHVLCGITDSQLLS